MEIRLFPIFLWIAFVASNQEHDGSEEIRDELSPELAIEEANEPRFFAAVIDAGSTGTRLHLFEFRHAVEGATEPFELLREVKPGLSSFADNPAGAASSVEILLSHAMTVIPKRLVPHTPIILQATAGLRLLSKEEADSILVHVKQTVEASGLLLGDEAVGILSGREEGVFAWFTLNFLTGRLSFIEEDAEDRTAVALDLGGGSTQITFNQQVSSDGDEDSHHVSIFGREFQLYSHSYLGNGLIAARLSIASLLGEEDSTLLETHCLPHGVTIEDWKYAGKTFQVHPSEEASFEKCLEQANHFVENITTVKKIEKLNSFPIFAFSYFYDRGVQVGMVRTEPKTRGGWVQAKQFKIAAEQACNMKAEEVGEEHWKPWLCMDLTYIYSLLSTGYGISDEKNIHLTKKMRDMEVSWALGAGFHLLNSYHKEHFENFKSRNNSSNIFNEVVSYISTKATNVLVFLNLIS
ncbi:hypothetical protein FO519_007529 [Halicephalobus sp. NKZ332]|nr:hypothetical protein FO519_007529 [Halicephalobus sp. NKZ332]